MIKPISTTPIASSSSKKTKVASDDIYSVVKQHILNCPGVEKNHPAILGALKGLENEKQRQERDAKLRRRFDASVEEPVIVSYSDDSGRKVSDDIMESDLPIRENQTSNDESDDDWHDVNRYVVKDESGMYLDNGVRSDTCGEEFLTRETDNSHLGQKIAQEAVNLLGRYAVHVRSPLDAFLVVFHAALLSPTLQYICTGIPDSIDDTNGAARGFAAPIRDIPKTDFLPKNFRTTQCGNGGDCVRIRYRKDGSAGIFVLSLHITEQDCVLSSSSNGGIQVSLSSTGSKSVTQPSEPSAIIEFDVKNFLNTESWEKAWAKNNNPSGISPALHYKNLNRLFTEFCRKSDLGSVTDRLDNDGTPILENNANNLEGTANERPLKSQIPPISNFQADLDTCRIPETRIPQVDGIRFGEQWLQNRRRGDFDGDLAPKLFGGTLNNPLDPLGVVRQQDNMGNLFGPNHPSFRNPNNMYPVPSDDPAFLGVGGMAPRFDPYGPPPTDINWIDGPNLKQGPPNRGFGPNPDHMPPPGFGHNMFM